jgi:NAD(P)-dependent dehydrogenase (short-subunit alcohol dehydrogenase family)
MSVAVNGRPTTPRLAGRRAFVTGGGSGIGRATVHRLAAEGARVAVVDIRAGATEPVVAEVTAAGGTAIALTCDVRDEASVAAATHAAADSLGGLDTVVAGAGITATGSTHSTSLADWELVIGVNLTGAFLTVKHSLPHLLDGGGGAIVTIGSTASLVAAGRSAGYDASKGGVLQFTRAVAVEYVEQRIRANCVCPGVVRTNLAANSRELDAPLETAAAGPSTRLRVPMSRAADPSEIAAVVAFLCSDEASFLTGAAIPVDGGYTAI